jgi:tyrosyl-tRNA synthetase
MLGREFIQTRLGEDGAGISYAEFSYALIQGYDFLHLFREQGCTMQVCGSDQWGNSIAGVELIRRIEWAESHIWSAPLIINKATGKKFGKTESGTIWLDPDLTSPYQFYQFWLNVDDGGVEDYLKIYTLKNKQEIFDIMAVFSANMSERYAQKILAYEVTKIVHGQDRADSVKRISEVLFGGADYNDLSQDDFNELSKEIGIYESNKDNLLIDVLVQTELAKSKGEARRYIESGAIYLNGKQLTSDNINDTLGQGPKPINGFIVLRRGKNSQTIVKI